MNTGGAFVAGSIVGKLLLDKTGWNTSIKSIGKDKASLTGMASSIGSGFVKLGKMAAVAGIAAAGALGVMVKKTADAGDAIWDMSQRTGVAAKTLSGLKLAADKSGTSLEGVALGLRFLGRNMAAGIDSFKEMGVSIKDVNGNLRPMQDVMLEVSDRFMNMENGAQKTALAIKIFGRSGSELIPLLNLGSAGLREQISLAEKLGMVFTEKTAKAADRFMDSMVELKGVLTGMRNDIGNALIPVFTQFANGVTTALAFIRGKIAEFAESGQLQEWATSAGRAFIWVFKLMTKSVEGLMLIFPSLKAAMFSVAEGFYNILSKISAGMALIPGTSAQASVALRVISEDLKVFAATYGKAADDNIDAASDIVAGFDVLLTSLDLVSKGLGKAGEDAAKAGIRAGAGASGWNMMTAEMWEMVRLHKLIWPEIQHVTESLQATDLPLAKYTEHFKLLQAELYRISTTSFDRMAISFTEAMSKIATTSQVILSAVSGVISQGQTNSTIAIENEYKNRLAAINATITDEEQKQKAIMALEAEFQIKRSSARRTWAIAEKGAAIAQAFINASLAATKVLGQAGLFGIPLVPLIWGLCMAQIALIAAQPIPLAEGATFEKPTLLQNVLVGEKRPEYLLDKPKLTDIVRDALMPPAFMGAPAMAMAGAGGGGQTINATLNFHTTGLSRRDFEMAADDLLFVIKTKMRGGWRP